MGLVHRPISTEIIDRQPVFSYSNREKPHEVMGIEPEHIQLDFLSPDSDQVETRTGPETVEFDKPTPKRKWIKGVIFIITLGIFLFSLALYIRVSATPLGAALNEFSWLDTVKHLLLNGDKQTAGENRDRVNVLLLGMGGEGHDGAYLTDTMMVVSLKPSTKQVAMVSIPRDLYVDMGDLGWRKINSANAYGETGSYPGGGAAFASQIVSEVIGQPIDYYVRIDFNGFKKLIDDLGGVDVNVTNAFSDNQYPDYEHGYQTISFAAGEQHLDGEKALQYARSRHGNNGQGSDFARSKRQMQILLAVKDKSISAGTLLNPSKLSTLFENVTANISTNIKTFEALRFAQIARGISKDDIINKVLDNGPDGLLRSYVADTGAYVLTTRAADFSEIHQLFANIFSVSTIGQEQPHLIIYNGTNATGLANQTASNLEDAGFLVLLIGNAPTRDWDKTAIYDVGTNEKSNSLKLLETTYKVTAQTTLPFEVEEKINQELSGQGTTEKADFVIVLGADQTP